MWETLLDALIDTLKVLPVLLVVYLLLELLEYKGVMKFENSKLLKGGVSPVFGALFGCVPQCGFSVLSTDLYSEKKISVGALVAVFIATSDEAVPIMIADISSIPQMFLLIAIKLVMGITIGYLAMFLYGKIFKPCGNNRKVNNGVVNETGGALCERGEELNERNGEEDGHSHNSHHASGCCKHNIEQERFDIVHPILHCLKITAFILVVNIIFGVIIYYVGQENLGLFLTKSFAFQPLLAVLIGLIPNCASSLVLTELYLSGGLTFGAIVAGLSVNAGLGLIVLFKQNKNIKENIFILLMLIIPSLLVGYGIHFIF